MELFRWFKAISTLKNADMIVMTGTGMLGDFGILPLGLHYEILKWSLAAKLSRCKLLFLSVGAGPIHLSLSQRIVKAALSCADYRSYRDDFSRNYLANIGFDTARDLVYPDLAFSYPTDMLPARSDGSNQRAVVGLGVMAYFNKRSISDGDETIYRTYIAQLAEIVGWLLEKKYTVRLLIGDTGCDDRARVDLKAHLNARGIRYEDSGITDEPAGSVGEVLSQIDATDLVIASRFHNILLALMLGKPVLALSYHEKIDALMADMGLPEFCQDIEQIDLEKMAPQFDRLVEKASCITQELRQKSGNRRTALNDQYERIFRDSIGLAANG